jgi:hypothetical protein
MRLKIAASFMSNGRKHANLRQETVICVGVNTDQGLMKRAAAENPGISTHTVVSNREYYGKISTTLQKVEL